MIHNDIKVGDTVILKNAHSHNSDAYSYNLGISFSENEVGKILTILDISKDVRNDYAYQVMCNKGITYLRRGGFEPIIEQQSGDLSYLIDFLKQKNIN